LSQPVNLAAEGLFEGALRRLVRQRGPLPGVIAEPSESAPTIPVEYSGYTACGATLQGIGWAWVPNWPYERAKFQELIVFIARECADHPSFGDTYLNKALFFSDAVALQTLGRPITGARYQKLPFGPAARALLPVRDELVARGDLTVEMVGTRRVSRAVRDADLGLFSEDEIAIVRQIIDALRGLWATEVSDLSHALSPGWKLVELNEDIPLESQFISTEPIPQETLERGRELAARFGW
jgi:hypothetical protein